MTNKVYYHNRYGLGVRARNSTVDRDVIYFYNYDITNDSYYTAHPWCDIGYADEHLLIDLNNLSKLEKLIIVGNEDFVNNMGDNSK